MGCCCCCFAPSYSPPTQQSQSWTSNTRTAGGRPEQQPCYCTICGMYVHPAMLDSHREVCRLRQRQQQQQQNGSGSSPRPSSATRFDPDALKHKLPTTDDDAVVNPDEYPMEVLCVICLERLRCYAFLPCGHVVCCRDCAARCDSCPVCRSERAGLCFVPPNTIADYHCKRCGCFIAPAIFDGHREVCALQMRRQAERREAEAARLKEEAAAAHTEAAMKLEGVYGSADAVTMDDVTDSDNAAASQLPPTQTPPAAHAQGTTRPAADTTKPGGQNVSMPMNLCVECLKSDKHLVITVPCGHRVMCVDCAKTRRSCPVCYQDVSNVLVTYD